MISRALFTMRGFKQERSGERTYTLRVIRFFKYNAWPNTDCCTLFQRSYMKHLPAKSFLRHILHMSWIWMHVRATLTFRWEVKINSQTPLYGYRQKKKSCSSPRRGRSSPMMPLSSQWSHQSAGGSSQLDALLSHHITHNSYTTDLL